MTNIIPAQVTNRWLAIFDILKFFGSGITLLILGTVGYMGMKSDIVEAQAKSTENGTAIVEIKSQIGTVATNQAVMQKGQEDLARQIEHLSNEVRANRLSASEEFKNTQTDIKEILKAINKRER